MKKKNIFIGLAIFIIVILAVILFLIFRMRISKEEALDLAYQYIGVSKESISYLKVEKDIIDNKYEIKLNDGNYNYEIEIDGKSGDIIDFEKKSISNVIPDGNGGQNNLDQYKTKEEVKNIVLNHANINESNVAFTKVDMEVENGIMVYEIEFIYNNLEYEYEVNAITGDILKHKIDR